MEAIVNKSDKLLPVERVKNFFEGKEIDRFIFSPNVQEIRARILGIKNCDLYGSVDNLVNSEVLLFNRYGYDWIDVGPDAIGISQSLGSKFEFPEYSTPNLESPLISKCSEWEQISLDRIEKSGDMKIYLDAVKRMREIFDGKVIMRGKISSPMTIASFLVGTETLMRGFIKDKENVHQLLRMSTEAIKICIDLMKDYVDCFQLADPISSGSLMSRRNYMKFTEPYTRELIDYANGKSEYKCFYHVCGETESIWDIVDSYNLSVFSIDNQMDMKKAILSFDNVVIGGNVDPVDVILFGDKKKIYDAVKENIERAVETKKKFVIIPGCGLASKTPIENIDCYVGSIRELSKIYL